MPAKEKLGIGKKVSEYISVIAIVIILLAFTIINPRFLGINNISNLLSDISVLLVMSIGITFVLIIGSIDLSTGAICSCAAVIFAVTIPQLGGASIILSLIFGAFAGAIAGILHAKFKVPSFIGTFGTMQIWVSCAMIIANGASKQITKPYHYLINWFKIKIGFIPLSFIVAIAIVLIMLWVQKRTQFGKKIYAIGGNESAARMAGINVVQTKTIVFALAGFFSAMGGIMLASKLKSGIPTVGETFNMQSIAAVALGGTSMAGGKGGLIKTVAGVILIILIQNGMNVIGISAFWQQITFGALILAAVALTTDRSQRNFIVK